MNFKGPWASLMLLSLCVPAAFGDERQGAPAPESSTRAADPSARLDTFDKKVLDTLMECELPVLAGAGDRWTELRPKLIHIHLDSTDYPFVGLGNQAVIMLAFLVDANGNVRFAHLDYAFPIKPAAAFIDASMRVLRRASYQPVQMGGHPTAAWTGVRFKYVINESDGGPMGALLDQRKWDKVLGLANAGDVNAIEMSAYVAELVRSESGLSEFGALSLLAESAQNGEQFARMDLARRLSACQRGSLADEWITMSAARGLEEAQLWVVSRLLRSADSEYLPKVGDILRQVAQSNEPFYRLWAAGLLATAPEDSVRDPAAALSIANELMAHLTSVSRDDPDYFELKAAAEAPNAHYSAAVSAETEAISHAHARHWNTQQLETRLQAYQSGQAWRGYLCDCDKLVPGQY